MQSGTGIQPSLLAVTNPDAGFEALSPTPLAPPNELYRGELKPPVLELDAKLLVPPWVPTVVIAAPAVPEQSLPFTTAFVPPIPTTTVTLVAAVTAVAEVCVTPPPPPPRSFIQLHPPPPPPPPPPTTSVCTAVTPVGTTQVHVPVLVKLKTVYPSDVELVGAHAVEYAIIVCVALVRLEAEYVIV